MSTNREDIRDALTTLLAAALVGTGLPVKTVVGSFPGDLKGRTPLVAVTSGGTLRETQPINMATFLLDVVVFVLKSDTGWTTANAEDALDEIESLISATYDENRGTADWEIIQYAAESEIGQTAAPGLIYYVERIPTIARLTRS